MRLSVLFLVLCLAVLCVYAHKSKGKHHSKRTGEVKSHRLKGGYTSKRNGQGKGKRNAVTNRPRQNSSQDKKDKKAGPKELRRPKSNDKRKRHSPVKASKEQRRMKKSNSKEYKPRAYSLGKKDSRKIRSRERKNQKKKTLLKKLQTPKERAEDSPKKKDHSHEKKGKGYSHKKKGHSKEKKGYSHGKKGHSHEKKGHSHGKKGHSKEKKGYSHGKKGHSKEKKGYSHGKKGHSHEKKGHSHEKKGHSKEKKGYSHGKKGHSHEKKGYSHGKKGHSHEKKGHSHEKKGYSKEKKGHSLERKGHSHEKKDHSLKRKVKQHSNERGSKESHRQKGNGIHCILQKCSSQRKRSTCTNNKWKTHGKIISIAVVKKISKKKCQHKKSYGFTAKSLWASRGCSAIFKVCYKRGDATKDEEAGDAPKLLKDKTKDKGFVGCFKDNRNRLLKIAKFRSHRMTVGLCLRLCSKQRTKYFGVENGVECFCGNDIAKHGKVPERECRIPCKGNKKQKCGGIWRISVYKGDATKDSQAADAPKLPKDKTKDKGLVGCFKDSRNRLLKTAKFRSHRMTVGLCLRLCSKKRTKYFGVENGVECFCGNDIAKHGKVPDRECKMPCKGNKKQKCGGIWRISVYKGKMKSTPECHRRAKYRRGKCVCRRGYYGDGIKSCEKTCSCMASGDPHYKTYDGQMIHFMGTCKYILTKTTKDEGQCSFSVEVKNEHRGRNTKVSYTRTVDLKIYGRKIRLSQGGKVSIDGQKKFLPVKENNNKIKVFRSGRFVQVWTECGIEVNYDGVHAVYVVTPARYKRNLEGLCGDCNGKKDDFKTRKGREVSKLKNKYALIGESYSVEDDSDDPDTRCETEDVPFQCEPKMNNLVNEPDICGDLQSVNGRFSACVKAIPLTAREYYKSCVMDMCSYEGEVKLLNKVKCSSLESFVEECAENGIEIKWRTDKFCPLRCEEPNMVYKASGSGCPATCIDPKAPEKCTIEDREGCFCKPGFVLSDNKCIKSEECGCKDSNGDYFPIGSKKGSTDCSKEYVCKKLKRGTRFVQVSKGRKCHRNAFCRYDDDGVRSCVCKEGYVGDGYKKCKALCGLQHKCHKQAKCRNGQCVCRRGLYGDGINSCEKMCTCTASGDPHYRTFDGQMIHFMGDCKYTLAKSTTDIGKCSFNVEVKNFKRRTRDRVSFTRYVEVQLGDDIIQLLQGGKLFVNKHQVYLPFKNDEKTWQVYTSGNYLRLKTSCDISVLWNGKSVVQVVLPKKYGNAVTGICGNCNGKKDDYRTKEGLDVSRKANKYSLIGNSYQVKIDKDGSESKKCKTDDKLPQCSREMMKQLQRDDHCGFLKLKNERSPFKDCVNALAKTSSEYLESCKVDACAYSDDPKEQSDVICMNLAAFAEECLIHGYKVKWRTSSFCPIKCGRNMRYSEAVSGCPATCTDPEAPRKCQDEPTEGCECLAGYLLSNDQCVSQNDCGCVQNGEYYPLNTTLVSADCTSVDQCVSRNGEPLFVKIAINIKCHSNGLCGLKDGTRKCICADGYVGDGIKECRRPTTLAPSTTTIEPLDTTTIGQQTTSTTTQEHLETTSQNPITSTTEEQPETTTAENPTSPTTEEQLETTTQLQTLTITDEQKETTTANRPTSTTIKQIPVELNDEPSTTVVKDVQPTPTPPPCNHPAKNSTSPTTDAQLETLTSTTTEEQRETSTAQNPTFTTIEERLEIAAGQNPLSTTTEEQVETSTAQHQMTRKEKLETATAQKPTCPTMEKQLETLTAQNSKSTTTEEQLETYTARNPTSTITEEKLETSRAQTSTSTTTEEQLGAFTAQNPTPTTEHIVETSPAQNPTSTTTEEQLESSTAQRWSSTTTNEQLEASTAKFQTSPNTEEQLEASTTQNPTSTTEERLEISTAQNPMSTTTEEQLEVSKAQPPTYITTEEQLEASTAKTETSPTTEEQLEASTAQHATYTTEEHLETSTEQNPMSTATEKQLEASKAQPPTYTTTGEQLETSTAQTEMSPTTEKQFAASTALKQMSTTTEEQFETSTQMQTSSTIEEHKETATAQRHTPTSTTILKQLATTIEQGPLKLEDEPSTIILKDIKTTPTPPPCDHQEPECSVIVRHDSCGTETILTGNCAYSNQFTTQCQYMVSTGIMSNGDYIADVTVDGNKTRLKSGQILKNCAKFAVKGSLLVITEDTCERCILQFIRNMVPRNQCVKF